MAYFLSLCQDPIEKGLLIMSVEGPGIKYTFLPLSLYFCKHTEQNPFLHFLMTINTFSFYILFIFLFTLFLHTFSLNFWVKQLLYVV